LFLFYVLGKNQSKTADFRGNRRELAQTFALAPCWQTADDWAEMPALCRNGQLRQGGLVAGFEGYAADFENIPRPKSLFAVLKHGLDQKIEADPASQNGRD
jgi:hypothetical protein